MTPRERSGGLRGLPAGAAAASGEGVVVVGGGGIYEKRLLLDALGGRRGRGRANRVHKGEIDLPFSDQVVSVVRG